MENEGILGVQGLEKVYGKKVVLAGVNFSMHKGEIVGFLGPNGAGKTTMFYLIVGFIKATRGTVFMNSLDISNFPMYKRARLGISYLPQETSIFRKLTVEDNIMAILETRKDLDKKGRKEILDSLLENFRITEIRKQMAYTLSGGERRRSEIARALAIEPSFLLLDEPFAGIDPIAVSEIKRIVKKLSEQGIGILITDHNVRDTLEITNRAYIINLGKILISGSKDDILANDDARQIYLGDNFSM